MASISRWLNVDRETGGVAVERYVIAYDIGRAINPALVEGQIASGIAALVEGEFLHQRAAEPLRKAAHRSGPHQRRIDGAADVIGDDVALDRHAAGLAIDIHHREMDAIGINLVLYAKPAPVESPGSRSPSVFDVGAR